MASEAYRFYCLDGAGRLHNAEWLDADGDGQAIALVETRHRKEHWEIWQGKRLVAELSPVRRQA